jgi:diamine N-acetyltransferase
MRSAKSQRARQKKTGGKIEQGAGLHPVVRPAGPEHIPAIITLAELIWRAHYPGIISQGQIDYMLERMYHPEVIRREMGEGIYYRRLLIEETLRGFTAFGPAGTGGEMKLHKLYVHPDWQRRGLGSLLLRDAEETSRQTGFSTLILAVNKANAKAIAAYRKNGYTLRDSVCVNIGGGFVMDDFVMERSILMGSMIHRA